MTKKQWTVMEVVSWTAQRLQSCGGVSPRLDAELLLAQALGVTRIQLYLDYDKPLTAAETASFKELVRRRVAGESVAHIVGHKEFWKHRLATPAGVFVPRPETEQVVEEAVGHARARGGARVLDLCTGSGAILVSVLADVAEMTGVGVDVSEAAVKAATENAERVGVAQRCRLVLGDAVAFVAAQRETFDVVTCNPPYVASAAWSGLSAAITRFEPRAAVDGGGDGLDFLRALLPVMPRVVSPGGLLLIEYGGAEQTRDLTGLVSAAGFLAVRVLRDLAGIDRVLCAEMPV
jgi:release factor glutamine methyltransferase